MIVAIDMTSLYGRHRTGVELYAIDLYRSLLRTGHKIIPVFHCANELDDNPDAVIIPRSNRLVLENFGISRAFRKIKPDIALFPVFPPPVDLYFFNSSKIIKVAHDLTFFRYRDTISAAAKYYYAPKTLWSYKHCHSLITISESVRHELADYTRLPVVNCGEDIAASFRNAEAAADPADLAAFGLVPGGYYISVSTVEPRKNLKYLLRTLGPVLQTTGRKLVLAGKRRPSRDTELAALIETYSDNIVFTGYVEEKQLYSLYRHAHAFVLLSVYEGFGRTPFEAVASGCRRIILSDIPVFRETFDGNALFVPLDREDEARALMQADAVPPVSDGFEVPFDVLRTRVGRYLDSLES